MTTKGMISMSANETVREVCAEMLEPSSTCKACDFVQCPMLAKFAEEVKEAHEREMAAKDAQIKNLMEINDQVRDNLLEAMKSVSAKDAEIARLKECHCEYALPDHGCMAEDKHFHKTVELERKVALLERALKPVMECSDELDIDSACAFAEQCISGDRCTCYGGKRCWVKFLHAVREAQRIMQEGEEK